MRLSLFSLLHLLDSLLRIVLWQIVLLLINFSVEGGADVEDKVEVKVRVEELSHCW